MNNKNHYKLCNEVMDLFGVSADKDIQGKNKDKFQRKLFEVFSQYQIFEENQPIVKTVSILISDIRGFTSISEKYPAIKIINLLNNYFQIMGPIISKYGGIIDKYMGDSIMAIFDADDDQENSILNTLACALEMQIAMNTVNEFSINMDMENLYMGIGINTGRVVSSSLGSDNYRENTVIGDQVNLASRVEAFSLRGQILVSENTFEPVKQYLSVGESNEVSVKGKSKPIKIYELLAISKPLRLESPKRNGRKSPRVQIDIPSNFQKIDGKKVSPIMINATIKDLSYGGVSLVSNEELKKFSEIRLFVSLSILDKQTSEVYAKVLRINSNKYDFEMGLEFTSIDNSAQKALKSFIDSKI